MPSDFGNVNLEGVKYVSPQLNWFNNRQKCRSDVSNPKLQPETKQANLLWRTNRCTNNFHPSPSIQPLYGSDPPSPVSRISTGDNWESANGQQDAQPMQVLTSNNAPVLRRNAPHASIHWFYDNAILRLTGALLQFYNEVGEGVHCWGGWFKSTKYFSKSRNASR